MKNRCLKASIIAALMLSVSHQAMAQSEEKTKSGEIVIITASRKQTNLMKTSLPVTAVTQEELTRQNITSPVQIADIVPNLEIHISPVDSGTSFTLRGVTSNNNTELGDPSVALHVDGVYSPRPQGALTLMYDLDRLEVLRGPQGTLYGRNATGGSINVINSKPKIGDKSASLGIEFGNYFHRQGRGTINIPVNDQLAFRFNLFGEKRNGWADQRMDQRDLNGDGVPDTDQRYNHAVSPSKFYTNSDKYAYRLSGLYKPMDNLDILGTYEVLEDRSVGGINFQDCERTPENCKTYGLNRDTVYVNVPGQRHLSQHNIRLSADWKASENLKVKFAYGHSDQKLSQRFDDDSGRRPMPGTLVWAFNVPAFSNQTQWEDIMQTHPKSNSVSDSYELQLHGKNGKLDWQVGYFNFSETTDSLFSIENPFCCSAPWLGGTVVIAPDQGSDSQAFFGNASFKATDKLSFNVGLRTTTDKKHALKVLGYNCYGGFNVDINTKNTCSLSGGKILLEGADWSKFATLNGWPIYTSADLAKYYRTGIENLQNYALTSVGNFQDSWSHFDYRLGADFDINENNFAYAYIATGYKAGGFSAANNFDGSGVVNAGETVYFPFKPETVINYEIGLKNYMFGHKLRNQISIFRSRYKDKQETSVRYVGKDKNTGLDITALVTDNVADSILQGIEIESNLKLGNHQFDFSGSMLDTYVVSNPSYSDFWFCAGRSTTPFPCNSNINPKGMELPFAPDYKLSLAYSYKWNLSNGAQIKPWVQIHHESSMWLSSPNFNQVEKYSDERPAFTTVNANISYTTPDGRMKYEVYCSNCTDQWVRTFAIPDGNGQFAFGGYRDPLFYGVRAVFNF